MPTVTSKGFIRIVIRIVIRIYPIIDITLKNIEYFSEYPHFYPFLSDCLLLPNPLDPGLNRSKYRGAVPDRAVTSVAGRPRGPGCQCRLQEDLTHVACIAFFQPLIAWF